MGAVPIYRDIRRCVKAFAVASYRNIFNFMHHNCRQWAGSALKSCCLRRVLGTSEPGENITTAFEADQE